MKHILGLHIGLESIGWALVRQSNSSRIVNMGARIFTSFVNHLGEGERESSNATIRTQTRNARNVYVRKTYRKKKMLSFLAQKGLCPLTPKELEKWKKEIHQRLNSGISLWENVYRVQRISSKYYEFRQVYDLDVYDQSYPNYVRILNFSSRKTGWLTHNPFKVSISVLGEITPFYKLLKVPEMH